MIANTNYPILRKRLINRFLRLKAHLQLEIRKILRIQLYILLDRQALSEHDKALMIPIYK